MKTFTVQILLASLLLCISCEDFAMKPNADTFFHVRIEGTELPVWVRGNTASNKLIIYINGGPGLTSIDVARADMFGWVSGLEASYGMVYYDQRGCGNAQGNIDESTLTLEQFVQDLDAIVEVLNQKYANTDIYLMGHSFGGFIGTNYLLNHDRQKKIAGWICIDGAHNFDFDVTWQYRRSLLEDVANEEIDQGNNPEHWNAALAWLEDTPLISTREQKDQWRSFIGQPGEYVIPEEIAELSVRNYLQIGFFSSYNPFPAYLSSNLNIVNDALNKDVEGKNLINELGPITLPVLFIWGKYDDLIPSYEGQDAYKSLGTSANEKEFIILQNSSHEPYISSPDEFRRSVLDFLEAY